MPDKIIIKWKGLTPSGDLILEVTINRIDGESIMTKIVSASDPEMGITEDELI